VRRNGSDGHAPPVNWRELTAPAESPAPPVNWRERAAHNGIARAELEFDGSIVPERQAEEAAPRKMGFFERLGFGRRRA
jgi:hypothetical protein